jgi:hypothetical protein
MTHVPTEQTMNTALIGLSRSFLQYVAESWPWVDEADRSIERQLQILASRQRLDVGDLVGFLVDRDWNVDFGTFPTEYTDLHFISLSALFEWLTVGQAQIDRLLSSTQQMLKETEDLPALHLVEAIALSQNDIAKAMKELQQELADSIAH